MDNPVFTNNEVINNKTNASISYISSNGISNQENLEKDLITHNNKIDENCQTASKIIEKEDKEKKWDVYTKSEKLRYAFFAAIKVIIFIILLYLFLLSLSFMTIGFTMVTSYALKAGPIIKFVLSNPFAALAIGIIATALMQNATATTSIAVSMVGAGIIPDVQSAIPIIMGANIGTCVTNSFIALTLSGDPHEFKRAFSSATLNDMFNLLTTSILLPFEIWTNFLFRVSDALTNLIPFDKADVIASANFMAFILNPVVELFIVLDADAVNAVSNGADITQVAMRCCQQEIVQTNSDSKITNVTICYRECSYWCMPMLKAFGDGGTGLFWIILSIIVLIACLFGIVKVLSLLIVGPIANGVQKAINASFPKPCGWFTEVVLFLIAFALTIIVQSSNIITATLVPLCGIGIVTLKRVFVMTLGSNIGTTVTGILTAFTQPPLSLKKAMQLAFVYTMFNSLGVVFWLPIPFLRFPIVLATQLGEIVFRYRWFLFVYVSVVYVFCPLLVFGLALVPHWIGLAIVGIPFVAFIILFLLIRFLRSKCPGILPSFLKDFKWLPVYMRSLKPYDDKMQKISCCQAKSQDIEANTTSLSMAIRRLSAISIEPKPSSNRKTASSNIQQQHIPQNESRSNSIISSAFNDKYLKDLKMIEDFLSSKNTSSRSSIDSRQSKSNNKGWIYSVKF